MMRVLCLALVLILASALGVFAASSSQIAVTVTINQNLSVSVTPNSYAFGSADQGQMIQTAIDTFTAVNDGNGAERLTLTVGNSANWTAGLLADVGKDVFSMAYIDQRYGSGFVIDPTNGSDLGNGVAKGAQWKFGLSLYLPTDTDYPTVEQTIPVTVTASPNW